MFYGIVDIYTYVLGSIFIVLLPGPNSLYVMSVASRCGVAAGYRGACGIFLGDTILMVLAATGAASLLHAQPSLFVLIKYVGAAYLAWLGIGLLRGAFRRWYGVLDADAANSARDADSPFHKALVISLLNPKAIFFFISFFIQFVDVDYAYPALSFAILGVIVQILSALYLSMLIFGGAYLAKQFQQRRRLAAVAITCVACAFIGFALKLATASLT